MQLYPVLGLGRLKVAVDVELRVASIGGSALVQVVELFSLLVCEQLLSRAGTRCGIGA